jgi:hypothetical protein
MVSILKVSFQVIPVHNPRYTFSPCVSKEFLIDFIIGILETADLLSRSIVMSRLSAFTSASTHTSRRDFSYEG